MKSFNIPDDDAYARFKSKCALKKKSMSKVVIEMMAEYVKKSPKL